MSEEPIEIRELFGGAVELSFPPRMIDVSDFRPIPDNQEVCFFCRNVHVQF